METEKLSQVVLHDALKTKQRRQMGTSNSREEDARQLGMDAIFATGTWNGINYSHTEESDLPEIDDDHPLTQLVLRYTNSVCALNDLSDYMNGGGNNALPIERLPYLVWNLEQISRQLGFKILEQTNSGDNSTLSIDTFLPFVDTTNSPDTFSADFIPFLRRVYAQTGHLWKSGNCDKSLVVSLAAQSQIREPGVIAETMKYGTKHAWTQLKNSVNETIVIDPFGVPDKNNDGMIDIIPHFCAIESVKERFPNAYRIYSAGRPINPKETKILLAYTKNERARLGLVR